MFKRIQFLIPCGLIKNMEPSDPLDERIQLHVIKDFVTDQEALSLLNHAHRIGYMPSTVVTDSGTERHPNRTSSSCMLPDDLDIVRVIKERACQYAKCNLDQIEGLQLVKYGETERYDGHFDYFDPVTFKEEIDSRGQRLRTILVYLVEPEKGGETAFPRLDRCIHPTRGTAIMWDNCQVDPDGTFHENPLTEHGGMPVKSGTKVAVNIWVRAHRTHGTYTLATHGQ